MSELESNNKPIRSRIVLLLRSKFAGIASLPRKSKLRLSFAGAAVLAAFPVAAFAVQGFSSSADSVNTTSQTSTDEPAGQANGSTPSQEVPPAASSSTSAGNSSNNSENNANVHTEITVNGQSIPVPQNGSTQQTINTGNGEVSVNVQSSSSNNNNGSSFTSVNSFSSSASASVNVNQTTNIGGTSQ